jgi:hypothetical protein
MRGIMMIRSKMTDTVGMAMQRAVRKVSAVSVRTTGASFAGASS